jgi:hypothetical protein
MTVCGQSNITLHPQVEVLEDAVQMLKLVPVLTTDEEPRLGAGQPTNDPTAYAAARAQWQGEVEGRLGGLRQTLGELRRNDPAMAEGECLGGWVGG